MLGQTPARVAARSNDRRSGNRILEQDG